MVLVVDDQELIVELVEQLCRDLGAPVVSAGDGLGALALAQEHQGSLRLALVDIYLPGDLNGLDLGLLLRHLLPGLPLVAMTGKALLPEEVPPFDHTLMKPFSVKDLRMLLHKFGGYGDGE